MTNHGWLAPDRSVQFTDWDTGDRVIVNFGDRPFAGSSSGSACRSVVHSRESSDEPASSPRVFCGYFRHIRGFVCSNPVASAAQPDEWGGFPVGVQTISLRKYSLPEVMRHLQGMGVRYVEFSAGSHLPATASDEQIAEARKLAADGRD